MSNEREIPYDVKREALCFREAMVIYSKNESIRNTKPIGSYCILVESIGPQAREFLVHVQSSMSIDGHFGGSKIISTITSKFHCLEEKRTEFVYDDGLHEKGIFIGIEDNFYHVKLTSTCPCDKSIQTKDLSFCANSKLISEGVNILLMRYLSLINYEGTLSFESITIDGDLTESNYREDGAIHTIKTYLTSEGRILRHNWLDAAYLLKINPLADPKVPSKTIRIETPLKDRWKEDIEMFSKYLDMKSSKIAENTEYLDDHPEIKQTISDYVQTLLVVKPQNVIDFTIQHFKVFAKDPIIWETSTLTEDSDTDVKPQLAETETGVLCSICGFYIECTAQDEISSTSSTEEYHKTKSFDNSTISNSSEVEADTVLNIQKKNDTTSWTSSVLDVSLQLKRICDECNSIIKVCDKHKSYSKCPGCLKVFKKCTKCFTIDEILRKLK
ncbi:PREDICTED: ciliogenesis-associated TTC17-interacting protein-like [Habropoda laboriosa]|uniref:ciliogenesis-associated TTC17-interacting protein-like n=1 Tax=Habropoda laboriosa TaxID=597456 RepID=UPI00083D6DD5|nr:PREDICTED: ciliogenesis-associated TTC17-interacting protein-like [Habropoda laboriosa]